MTATTEERPPWRGPENAGGQRRVAVDDLTHLRFAISPMWETVASLRVLRSPGRATLHAAWSVRARERLGRARLALPVLDALVPAEGHLADFITPTPRRRDVTFADELAAVGGVDEAIVADDLDILLGLGPGEGPRRVLERHRDDPAELRARAREELERYWATVMEPEWPRLRSLAEADIAHRLEQIAAAGPHGVLSALHPRVHMDGLELVVEKACRPGPVIPGRGLVLVPCAFAWPDLLFFDVPGHAPTLSYAPRGVGALWETVGDERGSALGELVGRTRASALHLLDLPLTTTQLAGHLGVTAPTMSQHLRVLSAAGLVESRRRGREVWYARTGLGDQLTCGAT